MRSTLSKLEQIVKIISMAAIPLIVGVVGWLVQADSETKGVRRDYVKMASEILSKPAEDPGNLALRAWAIRLLNHNSSIKFSEQEIQALQTGEARLPEEKPTLPNYVFLPSSENLVQSDKLIRTASVEEID